MSFNLLQIYYQIYLEDRTLFLGSVSQELHIHFSHRRENVNRRHLNE